MKFFTPAIIAFFLGASRCLGAPSNSRNTLIRRQGRPLHDHPQDSPMAKLISVKDLPPQIDKNAIRKVYRYGPYRIPGAKESSIGNVTDKSADAYGSLVFNERLSGFCGGECVVLKGSGVPEFENGTAATAPGQSIYNHHVFGINVDDVQPKHVCPGSDQVGKTVTTFLGGGTDAEFYQYSATNTSMKAGYEVKKGDRIDLQTELMNYRQEPQDIVMALDVEYLPGKHEGYLSTKTIEFVATPCDSSFFFRPTSKQYSTTSKEWIAPSKGYIINIRGHEHEGGSGVYVTVNGKLVCSSMPTYETVNEDLRVKEFSHCEDVVPLEKGDKVVMRAEYDTEKYPQRHSNSGHAENVAALVMITFGFPSGFRLEATSSH